METPVIEINQDVKCPQEMEQESKVTLYEIGDALIDEDGNKGIVCIRWNDGDICTLENDAAHPNPVKVGHWTFDKFEA